LGLTGAADTIIVLSSSSLISFAGLLGREPINLQGVRLARVRYAPIATKFRSAGK